MDVEKWSYGQYASSNYGVNTMAFRIGSLAIFFSYDTVVAFQEIGHTRKVRENIWKSTTGKHLNWLDDGDKKTRLSSDEFERQLNTVLEKYNLVFV